MSRHLLNEIEKLNDVQTLDADLGLKLFDWSQNVAELWLGSNNRQKREILDLLCLNRAMSDAWERVQAPTVRGKRLKLLATEPLVQRLADQLSADTAALVARWAPGSPRCLDPMCCDGCLACPSWPWPPGC